MKEFDFVINGNDFNVKIISFTEGPEQTDIAKLKVNGTEYEIEVKKKQGKTPFIQRAQILPSSVVHGTALTNRDAGQSLSKVTAPLPGVILKVSCEVGQEVKMGQTILILEAMKMQNEIQAPIDGKINQLKVKEGQSVFEGDELVLLS